MEKIKVSKLREYYGNEFSDRVLLLDVNESKESLTEKISVFTQYKGTSYIDFIDNATSNEDVVKSYQLLEMDLDKEDVRLVDLHDVYGESSSMFNVSLSDAVNAIYEGICFYKNNTK